MILTGCHCKQKLSDWALLLNTGPPSRTDCILFFLGLLQYPVWQQKRRLRSMDLICINEVFPLAPAGALSCCSCSFTRVCMLMRAANSGNPL